MQYTYVGIDSHKDTHTAVFLDCFFEKLGELSFDNLPSQFDDFLTRAQPFRVDGTMFLFGLEDVSAYGRMFTVYLKAQGHPVKHINALLVARERKNQNITQKSDAVDAECAARVLLSKFSELPDAQPNDQYWALRTLVTRRSLLIRQTTAAKNYLHNLLTQHYPTYRDFFAYIDGDAAIAFFMRYPSPKTLQGTSAEELADFLRDASSNQLGMDKARLILDALQNTTVQFQHVRDEIVQSAIRQLQYNKEEIELLEESLATFLKSFDCTLTSISGVDVVSAAQILSCIGDIRKFATSAKLARYAGIAPVTYASGKKDYQFANQRGKRELNSLLYRLAVRVSFPAGPNRTVRNSFFYEYYNRKLSEGKTKAQALKCVQRRLVTIIWTMLTNGEDYVNPPTYDMPAEAKEAK